MNSSYAERDSDLTTDTLVQRAQSGDRDAFCELVGRFHRRVLGMVLRMVGDRDLADEVAQEVFLAAYQSLEQFDQQSEFSTWLMGIAKNKSLSALRKRITRQKHEQNAAQQLTASMKLDYLENSINDMPSIDLLRDCLGKLKPEHQQLLQRHYRDNETAQAIADELGRSGSGIRMLFMRLRQTLHECMQRSLES